MAVSLTNSGSGNNSAATNHTASFGFTATAGRTLVCFYSNSGSGTTFSGLSSGWAVIKSNTGTSRNMSGEFAYKVAAGGETSLAVTTSASLTLDFIVLEYDGFDTSAPLDKSAENESSMTGSGVTSCGTGTTATLSVSDGFAISAWLGDGILWPGGSYSFLQSSSEILKNIAGNTALLFAGKTLSSSSGFQETITGTSSDQVYGCVAVFKQATAGTNVAPSVGSLAITGHAPTIAQTANVALVPAVGSLAITGHAPVVAKTANQQILPATGTVNFTGYAPVVTRTANLALIPGSGTLTITGHAPTVTQSAASDIIPGTGTITITGYAPTIAQSNNLQILPSTGSIVITAYAPSVIQSANQQVNPGAGSLSITGYVPTVLQSNGQNIIPAVGTITFVGHGPSVIQTTANNVDPLVGTVVITGYAPTVTRTTGGGGGLSAVDVWTYEIESGKTAEELMRMMAAVLLGKTTVTDLGGGNAIVTFEAANGSKIRVTATMTGSERTAVSYDDTF